MRVIIRLSLNGDAGSGLRNELTSILARNGLVLSGNTATYEGYTNSLSLKYAMRDFWYVVSAYPGDAQIDHFWMYADDKEMPEGAILPHSD